MKKAITIIFLSALCLSGFSQTKKDSIPPIPVEPSHTLTLTDQQWSRIFQIIRQNSKMTGAECEETIDFITKNLQAVEPLKAIEPPKKK